LKPLPNFDFGLISLSLGLGFLYFLLADLGFAMLSDLKLSITFLSGHLLILFSLTEL
jgi:hypothetical protein